MPLFQVTFSIGDRGTSGDGAFVSVPGLNYQTITVNAPSSVQAQRIVENMFGGAEVCSASPGLFFE